MSPINLIFLPAILFVGLITSYEDITLSRIKNKWIILGMAYSVLSYLFLFFLIYFKFVDYGGLNFSYIPQFALNFGISVLASYGFWKYGAWAPGDAKLFIAYSMLIPLDFYSRGYVNYFPSLLLLFNIFIPLLSSIAITAIFKLLSAIFNMFRHREELTKAFVSIGQFLKNARTKGFYARLKSGFAAYLFIYLGLQVALRGLKLSPMWMASMLLLFQPLIQWIRRSRKLLFFSNALVLLYFIYKMIAVQGLNELLPVLAGILKTFSLFGILRVLLALYVKYTQVQKIEISRLKAHMIPTEETLKNLCSAPLEFQQQIGSIYPDGFSKEQAEAIKINYTQNGIGTIDTYRTFPFAAWMFLGVVITLIFRQNIFTAIKLLLY